MSSKTDASALPLGCTDTSAQFLPHRDAYILNARRGTTTLNVRTACALTTSTVVNAVVNA